MICNPEENCKNYLIYYFRLFLLIKIDEFNTNEQNEPICFKLIKAIMPLFDDNVKFIKTIVANAIC